MARAQGEFAHIFKLLFVGNAGVGKSSILLRYSEDTFDECLQSTIGVDFKVKTLQCRGKKIKMTVWDTAGQERFRTLTSSYYRGAHGVLLVYDITQRESFNCLDTWLQELETYAEDNGRSVIKLLIGNKCDLSSERAVSRREAEAWARSQGMLFMETSAKTNSGITQVFNEMGEKILDNPQLCESTATGSGRSTGLKNVDSSETGYAGGCC